MREIVSLEQLDLANGRYSYADYLTWEFEQMVEIIKGKILPMAAPSRRHQEISRELNFLLYKYFMTNPCMFFAAPFDVRLYDKRKSIKANKDVFTVVQPDVCAVCDEAKLDKKGCFGSPDLVVEILSPGNTQHDLRRKYALYEEHGVSEYWIVFPGDRTITVFTLQNGRYEVAGEYAEPGPVPCATLPEFVIDWTEVFEGV